MLTIIFYIFPVLSCSWLCLFRVHDTNAWDGGVCVRVSAESEKEKVLWRVKEIVHRFPLLLI